MTKITLEQWKPVTWLGGYANCTHEVTNQLGGGLKTCARDALANEIKPRIYKVLRDYRQTEVMDDDGCGYPLVDALTLDGHSIDMGEREIDRIADELSWELTITPAAAIARAERAEAERDSARAASDALQALYNRSEAALAVAEEALQWVKENPHAHREAVLSAITKIAALKGGTA